MPVMLERWNDDKMDALDAKVDSLDTRFDVLGAKVDAVNGRVTRVEDDLRELRRDTKVGFERLHRLMVQFCGVALAALIGLIATQV